MELFAVNVILKTVSIPPPLPDILRALRNEQSEGNSSQQAHLHPTPSQEPDKRQQDPGDALGWNRQ